MQIRAVIFDLDGTLLDTVEDLLAATNFALAKYGYPPRTAREMKRFLGHGIRYMLACATPGGEGCPDFGGILAAFRSHYDVHCRDHTAPYPGIAELIARLSRAGIATAVVTNKIQSAAEELISSLFPGIGCVVGDSPAVERKPAPDGVLLALKTLGVPPDAAVYVGDSEVDLETAENAHLPCMTVLWGFRERKELAALGATRFFSDPEALGDFLLGGTI